MATTSNREFLAWCAWFEKRWERLTLTDYYLMRVAQRVEQAPIIPEHKNKITLESQKIVFEEAKPTKPVTNEEKVKNNLEKAKAEKAILFAITGYNKKKKPDDRNRN